MQTLPNGWVALFAAPHKTEYKLVINGVTYDMHQLQGTPVIAKPLMEKPVIGRVCSATLTATLRPLTEVEIPKSARVYAYCRLTDANGENPTEWLPQGRYYISSRDKKANVTITCRDEMLKAGQTYLDKTELDFPMSHEEAVTEIASIMGVPVDPRTVLLSGDDYRITEIDSDTLMSEILAGIAACNGGNWVMTEAGALRLIPLTSPGTPSQVINKAHMGFTDLGDAITISRVTMTNDEGDSYTAGTDDGYTLSVQCPYATQTVVNVLGNAVDGRLFGVVYLPYRCEKMFLNPAVELGDTVKLRNRLNVEISVVMHSISASCNVGFTCTAESDAEVETDDEYPYSVQQTANDAKVVRTDRKYYGNSITKQHGFRSVLDSGAYAEFNADSLEFVDENGKRCLYYDPAAKTFILDATLGADAIFTNSLYAEQGDVSELTVDRLSTSRRIRKFLLQDTSDDNYIQIQDVSIQFIAGTPAGIYNRLLAEDGATLIAENGSYLDSEAGGTASYVQALNRYGEPLWWQKDISDAEISSEGYPFIDGIQIFTTTLETGFPVYTYVYNDYVKAEYKFEHADDYDTYIPVQIWGTGSGYGNNGKGRIEKDTDRFKLAYTTRTGTEESLEFRDDGYVDVNKMRKPLRFDFSAISEGVFTEKIDGGGETAYSVSFDAQGRIKSIVDEQGHITEVIW